MAAPLRRALTALVLGCVVSVSAGEPATGRLLLDDEPGAASNNGQFYANPDRKRTSTQVFRWLGQKKDPMVWEKAGWSDATFLSDDGEYLVAGDYCERALPRGYTLDQVIATFYHRATPVRSVRLRELIVDPKKVKQGLWGQCMGFIKGHGNRFAIDTWEYRHLVFDGTTGALIEVVPGGPIPNIR